MPLESDVTYPAAKFDPTNIPESTARLNGKLIEFGTHEPAWYDVSARFLSETERIYDSYLQLAGWCLHLPADALGGKDHLPQAGSSRTWQRHKHSFARSHEVNTMPIVLSQEQ